MSGDIISTVVLGLAILLVLVFNIFFLVVFIRRKRLRTPKSVPISMLLLHLALIDVIAALAWTLYTLLSAQAGKWFVSDDSNALCKQQVFVMMFCNIITAHTLMALMFERFLWIFKPSKHQEIVFDLVILLFLLALYLFDGGIAGFTMWGFGEVAYFTEQNQCAVDYVQSVSHLNFTLAMHYWIPMGVIIGMYIAILIRVGFLKRRRVGNGPLVLEENMKVLGDSYADRLKMQYLKFKDAGSRSVKPKVNEAKEVDNEGYQSDDDDFNSSDEEKSKNDGPQSTSRDYVMKKKSRQQKKIYTLSRNDLRETHMYALIALIYFACWMPYVIRSIIWTYYYFDIQISATVTMATVCISHFCSCFKLPFYFLSDKLRGAMLKTLGCKKGNSKFDAIKEETAKSKEVTTEL
ncbi:hypothetical protein ACF0H5_009970 [Mactra antiquata]